MGITLVIRKFDLPFEIYADKGETVSEMELNYFYRK
jgi:hypothetical protein